MHFKNRVSRRTLRRVGVLGLITKFLTIKHFKLSKLTYDPERDFAKGRHPYTAVGVHIE